MLQSGKDHWVLAEAHVTPAPSGGVLAFSKNLAHYPHESVTVAYVGFRFDGASIPRAVRGMVKKTRKTRNAALPHDMNYRAARNGAFRGVPNARKLIDRMFYDDLRAEGVSWFKAQIMYRAVRIGGASSFSK